MRRKFNRGKLKFKPKFQKKLKLQKEILRQKLEKMKEKAEKVNSAIPDVELERGTKVLTFEPIPGTGRILTSTKIVMGQDTTFLTEIERGDQIIVIVDPMNFKKEAREVSMVMGDKSLSLKEPFSKNLITYSQFEIKKSDKVVEGDQSLDQKYKEKFQNFGKKIKKKKHVVEFRQKSGMWSYKTQKLEFDRELTREEKLDLRIKSQKGKYY